MTFDAIEKFQNGLQHSKSNSKQYKAKTELVRI